jgi:rsbT co-antagonist protein RsbR
LSDNLSAKTMLEILDRVPAVVFSSVINPATGEIAWNYVSTKMGPLYGITDEQLRADPSALIARIADEDRAGLEKGLAESIQTLAPLTFSGRIQHADGESRWVESVTLFTRREDGLVESYGQVLDVTERKRTEAALAASEQARQESEAILQWVVGELPVGVVVMKPSGETPIYNTTAKRLAGPPQTNEVSELAEAAGVFDTDGKTPFPNEQLPIVRAFGGEDAPEAEMIIRNAFIDGDCWIRVTGKPMRGESGQILAAMVAIQDITGQRALEQELRSRNEQLAASEEAKTALIERLRYAIDELSNPILEVWDDVLVIPIIGIVDSRRTSDMVQRLLAEVMRTQASFVIVDLTGVEIVDTKTADHLMKLVRKVEMVGARCVLTGIRPAVAETLVDIGVDLGRLSTLRNLKHGLREALRVARRDREGQRDLDDDEPGDGLEQRRRGR